MITLCRNYLHFIVVNSAMRATCHPIYTNWSEESINGHTFSLSQRMAGALEGVLLCLNLSSFPPWYALLYVWDFLCARRFCWRDSILRTSIKLAHSFHDRMWDQHITICHRRCSIKRNNRKNHSGRSKYNSNVIETFLWIYHDTYIIRVTSIIMRNTWWAPPGFISCPIYLDQPFQTV